MPIENWEAYRASAWDWSWIDKSLPRKMSLGDIDGALVLPSGHFLLIEGKRAQPDSPPVSVPKGQYLAFRYLTLTNFGTVIILGGTPPDQVYWAKIIYPGGRETEWIPFCRDDVVRFVVWWLREHDPELRLAAEQERMTTTG